MIFKLSTGWLTQFKTRHGIRELNIQGRSCQLTPKLLKTLKIHLRVCLNIIVIRKVLGYIGTKCQANHLGYHEDHLNGI